jgi:hypothetical protein
MRLTRGHFRNPIPSGHNVSLRVIIHSHHAKKIQLYLKNIASTNHISSGLYLLTTMDITGACSRRLRAGPDTGRWTRTSANRGYRSSGRTAQAQEPRAGLDKSRPLLGISDRLDSRYPSCAKRMTRLIHVESSTCRPVLPVHNVPTLNCSRRLVECNFSIFCLSIMPMQHGWMMHVSRFDRVVHRI